MISGTGVQAPRWAQCQLGGKKKKDTHPALKFLKVTGFTAEGRDEGEAGKEAKSYPNRKATAMKTIRSEGRTGFPIHMLNPDITG